jgi:hypothetical protein
VDGPASIFENVTVDANAVEAAYSPKPEVVTAARAAAKVAVTARREVRIGFPLDLGLRVPWPFPDL